MDSSCLLDSENFTIKGLQFVEIAWLDRSSEFLASEIVFRVGITEIPRVFSDKLKAEKVINGNSVGNARKGLADISNLQHRPTQVHQGENPSLTTKECIDHLHKENMALMKLLADRNKIMELTGNELQKLRINLQKVRFQNSQLAQAHSQMLAELNSGKDRLKALQHELGCKNSLLNLRNLESEEKRKNTCLQTETDNVDVEEKCEEAKEPSVKLELDKRPCDTSRRLKAKSKSLGDSIVRQVQSGEKIDNKRPCLGRQSARFKCKNEPAEDLFEIDDTAFPSTTHCNHKLNESLSPSLGSYLKNEEKEEHGISSDDTQDIRRSSIGRPLRQAAGKVKSYKEISLKIKMRRSE
ncbi:Shugoshin, C-terminal [Dillenia turbinata]|uniref:Shugoshin, C-terminal n=1 Tax=Dillenia turbinata TaxID=194707 RepID=A0AAN8ZCT0_9MAGN